MSIKSLFFSLVLAVFVAGTFLNSPASTAVRKKSSRATQTTHRKSAAAKQSSAKGGKASPKAGRASSSKSGKSAKKKRSAKQDAAVAKRLRRINRAFIASADLKPMARQLLQSRTKAAYSGVEGYARRHAGTDAGAMANLVLGYAHILDRQYADAISPLRKGRTSGGELSDYIDYFLASAYDGVGASDQVVSVLEGFETAHGDSLFLREAMVLYGNALAAVGRSQDAVEILTRYREPERSDVDLALGRAYKKSGDSAKAEELLKRVYYNFPLSSESGEARAELDALVAAGTIEQPTVLDRKTRADVLLSAHRWSDAAREYRLLLGQATDGDKPSLQAALGMTLHRAGNDKDAREVLQSLPESSEEWDAQRLLALAEMARSSGDESGFKDLLDKMRQKHATSPYFEEALLLGGNMYLLKRDYDHAIDFYRELQQRFPSAKRASYAHWKAAWLSYRQGRAEEAKKLFEEQVDWYSASNEVPAAMYWRARLAEQDHDLAKANLWYAKLAQTYRHYYYADLARTRLAGIGPISAQPTVDPIIQKIAAPIAPPTGPMEVPSDDLRAQRARLLENAGMVDFSVRELRAAVADGGAGWATREMARMYRDLGRYDRSLQILKRAVPSYYALDFAALPREAWEGLFPRPYWTDLRRYSADNGLDPYVVASLIRQESEFNPGAVSGANAFGLMQLLPGTGKTVAHTLRVKRFQTASLLSPTTNIQLGTRYFRELLDRYNGRIEYALAAYNAGANRVDDWLAAGNFKDPQEFVETIPFTETREYVQAIMRNASVYRSLYGISGANLATGAAETRTVQAQ